jgi:hypothetical protein
MNEFKPGAFIIGAACAYEAMAIVSKGRVPTWTYLTHSAPVRLRTLIVGSFCVWFVAHMFPDQTRCPRCGLLLVVACHCKTRIQMAT